MDTLAPLGLGAQIGADVGQRVDPTAIIVAEVELRDYQLEAPPGVDPRLTWERVPVGGDVHFMIRHLERLPLGTSYPAVVARLTMIYRGVQSRGALNGCWVDATGVGTPVTDELKAVGLKITPVFLTGGERATHERGELRLAKSVMVSRLQVLLQQRRIHLPQTAEAQALVDELLNYEIKVTESANLQFGAFKIGKHDDLATALGLACWKYKPQRKAQSFQGALSRLW